jgi:hypothetical protein
MLFAFSGGSIASTSSRQCRSPCVQRSQRRRRRSAGEPAKLPDLSGVDVTELKLMILTELERHGMGPEWPKDVSALT